MKSKPELIVFSQNLMGGGSSFHRNMLTNKPDDFFDIKCIYLDPLHWAAKRLDDVKFEKNDVVFEFKEEPYNEIAKRLNEHISNRQGAIVANLPQELITLSYFPKPNKTVYFICHDKGFLPLTKQFDEVIDVFIAHNFEVYNDIKTLLPHRIKDIHFIQHGVKIQHVIRKINDSKNLNLVFLARHVKSKGIYDLPKINQFLVDKNINVNWTILGDGEEREKFMKQMSSVPNFSFKIPKTTDEVITVLKDQDIYILPSSHDGLPVSLLEAMSVGCVPIVYNFSEGIKNVITNDIGFVVDLDDVKAIADKIELLNNERNLLFKWSKNGVEKVEKEFNIKNQAKVYFDLYKNYKINKKKIKWTFSGFKKRFLNYKVVNVLLKPLRMLKSRLK